MSEQLLDDLKRELREFAKARDWEQFHSPKNLSMALSVEAAELVEHFQWMTEEQSARLDPEKHSAVALEMADIFIFLLRLADRLGVNLVEATRQKVALNHQRYPEGKVRGSSKKYSEYK